MYKLYYSPGTCALAPHIALEEAKAPFTLQRIDMKQNEQRSPEYLKINPKGRVPALATDKGVLTESPAILEFIAHQFPDAGLVNRNDRFAYGEMQAFNTYLVSTVHIAFAHVFRPTRYADGEPAAQTMRDKASPSIDEAFKMINARLSDGRTYIHGDQYTISDPYLLVFSRWLDRSNLGPVDKFEHVAAHRQRIEARPATQKAMADAV